MYSVQPIQLTELGACSRTVGYFTPVHERGTKWDNIEEHIPTSLKQAPLIGFMSLAHAGQRSQGALNNRPSAENLAA